MPKLSPALSAILIVASRLVFALLCFKYWQGKLGLTALLILFAAAALFFVGKRGLKEDDQKQPFWPKVSSPLLGLWLSFAIRFHVRKMPPCVNLYLFSQRFFNM